jgi:hypothetical protein
MSEPLASLSALYEGRKESPLRATTGGLWHATPLPILAAVVPLLVSRGLLPAGRTHRLFDAGVGDGRLLAALTLGLPEILDLRLCGLECDPDLAAEAAVCCRRLTLPPRLEARRPRVAIGDYFEGADYARLDVAPSEIDVVFNYPDGNERRLLEWLKRHAGPGTLLVVLSPDQEPALGAAPEWRMRVEPREGVAWSLSLFAPGRDAVIRSRPSGREE